MNRKIVIVDIDGTISKVGDRLKFLTQKPKDWDSFYEACDEDEPIEKIIDLVEDFCIERQIIFCTGRRESVRDKTLSWIMEHFQLFPRSEIILLMRKDGDFRHDTIVKPELLEDNKISLDDIYMVFEDRNSMCAKWRELGLTCLQVADGDF